MKDLVEMKGTVRAALEVINLLVTERFPSPKIETDNVKRFLEHRRFL